MQITTSENLPSSRRVSHDVSTDGFLWVSGEHCSTIDLNNYLIGYNHCHAKLEEHIKSKCDLRKFEWLFTTSSIHVGYFICKSKEHTQKTSEMQPSQSTT
jgi:hypothetical protein